METGIEAVLLDWGGVLIDDPAPGLLDYCAKALGIPVPHYTQAHNKHAGLFQRGLVAEEVFWQKVCAELDRPMPPQPSLWGEAFRAVYAPREEVFALSRRVRERGDRCGTRLPGRMPDSCGRGVGVVSVGYGATPPSALVGRRAVLSSRGSVRLALPSA